MTTLPVDTASNLGAAIAPAGNPMTYTLTGLAANTQYKFWVDASGPAISVGPSIDGLPGKPITVIDATTP